jgi:SnoaL-like domain
MSTSAVAVSPYRAALDARDPDRLADACARDVVFNSPITYRVRIEGAREFADLFRSVLEVYDEFECVDELGTGDTRTVQLRARVGRQELEEVPIVRFDDAGKVREVTMFVRPLPGLAALTAALAPRLARRRSRWRGLLMAVLSRPLAVMTRFGDKVGARLVQAP